MTKSIVRRETMVPTAPKPRTDPREDAVREFLAFGLGEDHFALPLGTVREILKVVPITEVPRARPHILGILSVRGRIITIVDLRRRLRMPRAEASKSSRILLVDAGNEIIGLLVDEVHQVYRLHEDELELAAVVAGDLSEYVLGIGRPGASSSREGNEDILILLDPEPLLKR